MEPQDELRLRLIEYEVPCVPEGVEGVVGWNGAWGTYYWVLIRTAIPAGLERAPILVGEVYFQGGDVIDRITNLADLLNYTWSESTGRTPTCRCCAVRDAPTFEAISWAVAEDRPIPSEVEDYLIEAFDVRGAAARSRPRESAPKPVVAPSTASLGLSAKTARSFFARRRQA